MPVPFAAGTRVRKRGRPGLVGTATGQTQQAAGIRLVEVKWDGQRAAVRERDSDLEPISEEPLTLDEWIRQGKFGRVEDLRRLLIYHKLRGRLSDFVYSMEAAQIEFLEYQYKPVLKFLDSPTERLLIADEVGLGKTIESALIWLELQARRDARRLLVVCQKKVLSKWRREFRTKFGITLDALDATAMGSRLAEIRADGRVGRCAWICGYSGLFPWKSDIEALEEEGRDEELSPRGRLLRSLGAASEDTPFFDLVIFDEAHDMRNSKTATSRLGRMLSDCTRALLCVSATPVANGVDDLFTLLRLLDGDFFQSRQLFDLLVAENISAVRAQNCLTRTPPDLAGAAAALDKLKASPIVGKLPALEAAITAVGKLERGDYEGLLRAQRIVQDLNLLGAYITRTRRIQVKERRPVRRVEPILVEFTEEERRFYWAVTNGVRLRVAREGGTFSIFHLMTPQLRMASCIPAVWRAYRDGEMEDLDVLIESGLTEEVLEQDTDESAPDPLRAVLDQLMNDLANHDFEKNDSKYNALRSFILEKLDGEKAIIFSFFKGTLRYLARRLTEDGISHEIIHGDIDLDARDAAMKRFEDDPKARILLSSEVGSEGIDLQFCRVVVNYDLPWNPMRIEQRIGRIDRVGQKAEILVIAHFKIAGTIEERLYEKLHKKLAVFENSIGDLEAIVGDETRRLGINLLSKELTPAEETRLIEATELAIRTRLEMLRNLEEQAPNLAGLSDYIEAQISERRRFRHFITAGDLADYIEDFFAHNFPGRRLQWEDGHRECFTLELTEAARDSLLQFMDRDRRGDLVFSSRNVVRGALRREAARRDFQYINHFSPLIRWMMELYDQQDAGFFPVTAIRVDTDMLDPGVYAFRVQRWELKGLRHQEQIAFAVGACDAPVIVPPQAAEGIVLAAMSDGKSWIEPHVDAGASVALQERLEEDLKRRFDEAASEFRTRNETLQQIQKQQVRRTFDRRIRQDEQRIQTMRQRGRSESVIKMTEQKVIDNQRVRDKRLTEIEGKADFRPKVEPIAAGLIEVTRP